MANVVRYPRPVKPTKPRGFMPTPKVDTRGVPVYNPRVIPPTGQSAVASSYAVTVDYDATGAAVNSDSFGRTGHHPAFAQAHSPLLKAQAKLPTGGIV